jgi:SH3 domain-containing YSC84-like protein 1
MEQIGERFSGGIVALGIALLLFASTAWAAGNRNQNDQSNTQSSESNAQDNDSKAQQKADEKAQENRDAARAQRAEDNRDSDIDKRIAASARVLDEIMGVPDKAIPDKIMQDAKCIAVVPSMVKIAVGFGGSHGKGVATCRDANGKWSAPAPITVTGGSWGLQLGGQAIDLVMLVMNQQGMDHLLASKFKIGADASAAAGPVGREAGADTDWKMKSEVLTYSRARGIFAGVDLSGTAITQDKDETRLQAEAETRPVGEAGTR